MPCCLQDTDGSLFNAANLPPAILSAASAFAGTGMSWHSAVESEFFDPTECVYVRNQQTSNNGAFCSPALTFRRVMLNNHGPDSLTFRDLLLTASRHNGTSVVHFTK